MKILFKNSLSRLALTALLLVGFGLMPSGCRGNRSDLSWDKQLVGTWHFDHKTVSGTFIYNADGTTVMRLSSTPIDFKGRWIIIDRDKHIIENRMDIAADKPNRIQVTIDGDTMTQQAVGGDIVYTYTR